ARGEPADAQSDLFSFGVVLYEMATGKPAFSGKTMAVLFDGILNRDPKPIAELNPQLPAELTHVVSKALEKEKDLRYRGASDIRGDLKRLRRDSAPRRIVGDDEPGASVVVPRPLSAAPLPSPPTPAPAPPAPVVLDRKARRRQSPRRRFFRGAAVLLLILIVTRSVLRRRAADQPSAPPSLDALQVKQLTSSGNAIRPTISPDAKYIVYLEREADGTSSVWVRQTDATNGIKIFASESQRVVEAATI